MPRALTLPELIFINHLRARVRARQTEDAMVAKVAGFGGFVGIVKQFMDPEWDDMGAAMLEIGADLAQEKEIAKRNISNARAGVDALRAFNQAFGNGDPSPASGDSSGAQQQQSQQPAPADKSTNPQ